MVTARHRPPVPGVIALLNASVLASNSQVSFKEIKEIPLKFPHMLPILRCSVSRKWCPRGVDSPGTHLGGFAPFLPCSWGFSCLRDSAASARLCPARTAGLPRVAPPSWSSVPDPERTRAVCQNGSVVDMGFGGPGGSCRTWRLALPPFTVRRHSVTGLTFSPRPGRPDGGSGAGARQRASLRLEVASFRAHVVSSVVVATFSSASKSAPNPADGP